MGVFETSLANGRRKPLYVVVGILAGGLTIGAPLAATSTAGAQDGSVGLLGIATAQGVRMTYTAPDQLTSEVMDGAGPIAQSALATDGQSSAFASLPYPGSNGIVMPGVIFGLAGQSGPPAYPFYVRADYPVAPAAELHDPTGAYGLEAKADAGQAIGTANFTPGGAQNAASRATALTQVAFDAGKMTVTAEAIFSGLSLGDGALRIATVRSRSVSAFIPGEAKPSTTTELLIEGATAGGQAVTIGPDGVRMGGAHAPVPIGQGAQDLNGALAQVGIKVRTVSAEEVKDGAAADALEITSQHADPVGLHQGILVVRIGGALTTLQVSGDPTSDGSAGGDGTSSFSSFPGTAEVPAPEPATPPAEAVVSGPEAGRFPTTDVVSADTALTMDPGIPGPTGYLRDADGGDTSEGSPSAQPQEVAPSQPPERATTEAASAARPVEAVGVPTGVMLISLLLGAAGALLLGLSKLSGQRQ